MKRAVVMIVDGLRADTITPELTPRLHALRRAGRWFAAHRSVFPSATRVNSASIATGCYPAAHGLCGNAIALDEGDGLVPVSVGPATFRERWRRATGRTLLRPTLAERLRGAGGAVIHSNSSAGAAHMQDPDGHGHLYHRDGSHGPGFAPITGADHLDVKYNAAGDAETTRRFCLALTGDPAVALNLLWICEPDHSQHALELGSPAHHEVLAGSDERVGEVAAAVQTLRERGDDVLFLVGSDHGHETIDEIVPVTTLLVDAGLKDAPASGDVVLASSGMGALVYVADEARDRVPAIADWLAGQPWCEQVHHGDDLARVGLAPRDGLAIAFGMGKRDAPNRYGVRGFGHVAADGFTKNDAPGLGQHGGLGEYETRPFLIASGGRFSPGETHSASATVDIAPTVLEHLGQPWDRTDGRPLEHDERHS